MSPDILELAGSLGIVVVLSIVAAFVFGLGLIRLVNLFVWFEERWCRKHEGCL